MTISGVNRLVSIPERVKLDTVDDLTDALALFKSGDSRTGLCRSYHIFKGDHAQAYRQVCTSPLDRDVLAVRLQRPDGLANANSDHTAYFEHACMAFGHRASMLQYSRLTRAIVGILREAFNIVAFVYVDDFFILAPSDEADLCFDIFEKINQLIGLATKQSKSLHPTDTCKLLGLVVTISETHVTLDLDEARSAKLAATITDVLNRRRLTPAESSKLAGKLSFASTVFYGWNGRAYLRALYARSLLSAGTERRSPHRFDDDSHIATALRWFLWALHNCPKRCVSLHSTTPHVIIYTDAEYSLIPSQTGFRKHSCIGSVLAIPGHSRVFYSAWKPPPDIYDAFDIRGTDIHPLETMAVLFALYHWLHTPIPLGRLSRRTARSTSLSTSTPLWRRGLSAKAIARAAT